MEEEKEDVPKMFVFGNNREGQLGIGKDIDFVNIPTCIDSNIIEAKKIVRINSSAKQTFAILNDGSVMSCGSNDSFELGRKGRSRIFYRIDAVETMQINDVAIGEDFVIMVCKDGRLVSWGKNDMGQLGLGFGNREDIEKPHVNKAFPEPVIQISVGLNHCCALTRSGSVLTWGGNSKHQLGDGDITSSCVPRSLKELRHRPIVSISCGSNHTLVSTISGYIYSWGENTHGQLGLGDTKTRVRPELIRSLRSAKASKIATGGNHSMVISRKGLLFAFGSNSNGQLGIGSELKMQCNPTLVEKFNENWNCNEISCGSLHSIILANKIIYSDNGHRSHLDKNYVFVMGANSYGQLGINQSGNVYKPIRLDQTYHNNEINEIINSDIVGVSTSPLSSSSFIFTNGIQLLRPSLPSVDLSSLLSSTKKLIDSNISNTTSTSNSHSLALRSLRESIALGFSSIAVLNASFHSYNVDNSSGLFVELQTVRQAYTALFATENEQVLSTLARATLQMADSLRECPFDDVENLSVFLIVLENPLMLRTSSFHVAIERVINGILALPKVYRLQLFNWLKSLSSEYFSRSIEVLENYISFSVSNKTMNLNPTPAVLVLSSLYEANLETKVVPDSSFYNSVLNLYIDFKEEWNKYKESKKNTSLDRVFNFCAYPFLIDIIAKNSILYYDFHDRQQNQMQKHILKYDLLGLKGLPSPPQGVYVNYNESHLPSVSMILNVKRENLLFDVMTKLRDIVLSDISTLNLPLKVVFEDEVGIDVGGITKELLTLSIKKLLQHTDVLVPCGKVLWFSKNSKKVSFKDTEEMPFKINKIENDMLHNIEYLLGLLVGIASYNKVLVDIPLPSCIYKIMFNANLTLEDLWEVDSSLARGLQNLLDFNDNKEITDLGLNFTISSNPLYDNRRTFDENDSIINTNNNTLISYIELCPNGENIEVNLSNRAEFIRLFVNHTLYLSCKKQIDDYLSGIKMLFYGHAVSISTTNEVELLLNGSREIGDISVLRLKTQYKGIYNDEHEVINMFWNVLSELTSYEKHRFLQFVSGSDRVPVGGIQQLKLIIQSTSMDESIKQYLPVAHTCFNTLDLPLYKNEIQMKEKLLLALQNYQGFGLV